MTKNIIKPLVLIILDGWGYREETQANAIAAAHTPTWDHLWNTYPHSLISGSGKCVGLPEGQMGNSEVGHLTMGAGRVIYQDLSRIDLAIQTGEFNENTVLKKTLETSKINNKALHIMGLLSPGGVHSHAAHFHALVKMAKALGVKNLYIHAFLDGRDTPPRSAKESLSLLDSLCKELACGQIASIIGRYYAMDRDKRWDRIQLAYELLVRAQAKYHAATPEEALEQAYLRGENDEFVQATCIHYPNQAPITIEDGDTILFMNFRADRARELTEAFINPEFSAFPRIAIPKLSQFISLTEYDVRFQIPVVFPPQPHTNILAECLSKAKLAQLRIAETEKYAHVTFFFNGGEETPFPLEDRMLIPSLKVGTYDQAPDMSAPLLTDKLLEAISSKKYAVIICNYANPDMVGHTGNFNATIQAIETIDKCLNRIVAVLHQVDGEAIITADHGNAECMFDPISKQAHTAHTQEPVPFIYVGRKAKIAVSDGKLSDIAPTILNLLRLPQPIEMTGRSLVKLG